MKSFNGKINKRLSDELNKFEKQYEKLVNKIKSKSNLGEYPFDHSLSKLEKFLTEKELIKNQGHQCMLNLNLYEKKPRITKSPDMNRKFSEKSQNMFVRNEIKVDEEYNIVMNESDNILDLIDCKNHQFNTKNKFCNEAHGDNEFFKEMKLEFEEEFNFENSPINNITLIYRF